MKTTVFFLERISGPDDEPVGLDELKRQLRTFASDTTEDDDILQIGKAAREWVEKYTGRALMEQKWRLTIDQRWGSWPRDIAAPFGGLYTFTNKGELLLRRSPVISVEKFVDFSTGVEVAVPAEQWALREKDSKWPRLYPVTGADWTNGVFRVEFTAGWADSDSIPACFKQAIKLHAESAYDRDPDYMEKYKEAVEYLLASERTDSGFA